jgi:hypothetical protein
MWEESRSFCIESHTHCDWLMVYEQAICYAQTITIILSCGITNHHLFNTFPHCITNNHQLSTSSTIMGKVLGPVSEVLGQVSVTRYVTYNAKLYNPPLIQFTVTRAKRQA